METGTILKTVWLKSKLLVKGLIIGGLVLVLLIPTFYVQSLIEEREQRQKEAVAEVSGKWAAAQIITGPVLVLPYWQDAPDSAANGRTKHFAYFLPDELKVTSTLSPVEKHRGIYKVMLYNSVNKLAGSFRNPDFQKLRLSEGDILWNEAFVKMDITDTKGLNDELIVNWNNRPLALAPQISAEGSEGRGLAAPLGLTGARDLQNVSFESVVNLSGSQQLQFTPVGKSTTVSLASAWPHPSFTGDILPQTSDVKSNGFSASWKSLAHKRPFPQQWKDHAYELSPAVSSAATAPAASVRNGTLSAASFGVDLFVPVNAYSKTMRSVKYAVLCILLTFAGFFIIETTHDKSVHPFQYGLVGLALVMFYTLLLSFSEYISFNLSYLIASMATIGLIAWFVRSILSSAHLALLLSLVLVLMYTYVFTILQLQDYALLLGSVGLFLTLAVIMHFSRRIQW
ncbi:cell envelope integrity protein CreD [Paraflavisolibacter sp. H34]|uniref:cell envelope integrity protein CreD n=1 Tax=Huijunlia imazamoxiresistens TaxID=3127457 RepID=UPI00301744AD